jgi:hypothetical protein
MKNETSKIKRFVKKLLGIIVLSLLLSGNGYAEEINFKCKLPSGNLYNDIIKIDTEKKLAAGKFPFEKDSTKDIVKFVSLFEENNLYKGLFFTVNLIDNTILYQAVNKITPLDLVKYQSNFFEITKNADEILLGCERLKDSEVQTSLDIENDRSLIQSNYFCKGISTYDNLKIYDIKKLENNNFNASLELISETKVTPFGTYYASFDRGRLLWFIVLEKDLVAFQLLTETNGEREFRYIAYPLNDNDYNRIKPIYDKTLNFVTDKEYLDNEDKLFSIGTSILKKMTMNNLELSWGQNFSCNNNPETILFTNTNSNQNQNLPSYEFTDFEKNFLSEEGYNLDSNSDFYENDLSNALVTLGWYYLVGEKGFEKNLQKTILWNTRASDLGHSTGSSNLGLIYYAGLLGENKDLNKAHKYYILAAQQWNTSPHEPDSIIEEMDKFNSNPSEDFENLKNLFYSAISLQSNQRMKDLINLVDFSNKSNLKITVKDFINKGDLVCTNDIKFTVHSKLSNGNLIIKNFFGATSTKEDEISLLNYAQYKNEKIDWFEITDGIPAYNIDPTITKNSIYYDSKNNQLINTSSSYFITQKQFFKVRGPQGIALRERLNSLGSANNIKFEDKFYTEATKLFNLIKNNEEPLISICE